MSIFPKFINIFSEILIKVLAEVCCVCACVLCVCVCVCVYWLILKSDSKVNVEIQRGKNNKDTLEEEQLQSWKNYYKAIVIKTMWYWPKGMHTDQ